MDPQIPIKAVFFDLDGTLFDTAPDLTFSMNQVLKKHGRRPVDDKEFRLSIYAGTNSMVKFAFDIDVDHPEFALIKKEFLDIYSEQSTKRTLFFSGMEEVLSYLNDNNIAWGIVTNKPYWLSEPLINYFGIAEKCRCLVCGDSVKQRKPSPDPLLKACEIVAVAPAFSVYIGDTETDIIAAKAAGMHSVGAVYGYAPKESNPETWNADYLIHSPISIIEWLKKTIKL